MKFLLYQIKTAFLNYSDKPFIIKCQLIFSLTIRILRRHYCAMKSPVIGRDIDENEKLTVILLNHKRPENIGLIAQLILKAGFVGKLIISNNSQEYSIENYVKLQDSRIILINQKEPSGVGIRFLLARDFPSHYYLCIDDDIFLHPAQLQWLYWNIIHFPEHTHGIYGAKLDSSKSNISEWPFFFQTNRSTDIDILNGLFGFTQDHLKEFFKLCKLLGINDLKSLMNGEDIVLSFSGSKKPLIHDIGPIWECASAALDGVALHVSRPRFYEERWEIFSKLESIKPHAH